MKSDTTRNALLKFYDESCNIGKANGQISADTAFYILKTILIFKVYRTESMKDSYINIPYIRIKKGLGGKNIDEILQRSFEWSIGCSYGKIFSYKELKNERPRIKFCDYYNHYYISAKANKCVYDYTSLLLRSPSKFINNYIDKSVIEQINYFLSLDSNKRQSGIYNQFYTTLQMYLYERFLDFNIKEYGCTS